MAKYYTAIVLLSTLSLFACKSTKQNRASNDLTIEIEATAQRYHAALGSGDGMLFLVHLHPNQVVNRSALRIDSLVVHGKSIQAYLRADSLLVVEANYFVPKPPMSENAPQLPTLEAADPILYLEHYYPATLYVHYTDKAYAFPIDKFESISK